MLTVCSCSALSLAVFPTTNHSWNASFLFVWRCPLFTAAHHVIRPGAMPNGTACSFYLSDGVNCAMTTHVCAQVAMSTSTGHRTVHSVQWKSPSEQGFCDSVARSVGPGWQFAPPPPCTAVRPGSCFLRAIYVMCAGACVLQPGPPVCARCVPSRLGMD